jgi:hypothetical protein
MKQRLGLAKSENVPAPIQDLVDSAARDAAENAVEIAVIREVEEVTTRLARVSSGRNDGSKSPTASSDVSLLREAEQLAAKKKALEAAGFSSDEAMRILIAEVVGGHSRRRISWRAWRCSAAAFGSPLGPAFTACWLGSPSAAALGQQGPAPSGFTGFRR